MAKFDRGFDVAALATWDGQHRGNAVRTLFERWAMPGQGTERAPLRVGVRAGYLNLYMNGQSVVRLSSSRKGPKASVHQAYVEGRMRQAGTRDGSPAEQRYIDYDDETLAQPATSALIDGWIKTADSYAGDEKRFVDRLVQANAGALDLEMALPASEVRGQPRAAPRMDLVVLQGPNGGPYSLAFWEAKLASNPELRARADYVETANTHLSGPKVIHQLRKYQQWMADAVRLEEAREAYLATAQCLIDLHKLFGSTNAPAPECVSIWKSVVAAEALEVVLPPGLVIANRLAADHPPDAGTSWEETCDRITAGFRPHREKLERHGVTVHEVGLESANYHLPELSAGFIAA